LVHQAEAHLFGLNNELQDNTAAFLLFSAAASLGCMKAAGIVGFCLEFGIGTAQSFAACEPWYVRAARAGHALAMARLAFLRRYGRPHVRMNRSESESWQLRVAGIGSLMLPCNRPSLHDTVSSGELREDPLVWLWWAAKHLCNPAAQYALGTCYHDGVGVVKSPESAVQWYRKSADQGHPRGEGIMGYCYGEGFGIERDTHLALEYYQRAAQQGETVAMYNVGYCFEEGIGIDRDLKMAFQWYQRAAVQGNALAANSLGYFYEEGLGVERDYVQAVHWYKVAAEQGNPWAEHNLAYMYASGLGVARDDEQAVKWYRRAADQGHAGAQNKLGHCLQTGTGCSPDAQAAVQWYSKAAAQQYPAACVALAWCYENGVGVSRDVRSALQFVDLALKLGYSDHIVSDWCISLGLRVALLGVGQVARDAASFSCPAKAA
jgi:TPR repeat protein